MRLIAVVDIGKTHAKLILTEAASGQQVWSAQRRLAAMEGEELCELDLAGTAAWLRDSLAAAPRRREIDVIVPVAHGASLVFLDAAGAVVAAPDYEDPRFDAVAAGYAALRDPFALTLSPDLPLGLNAGRHIFFLRERLPQRFAAVATILPQPQYWAYFLSGVLASEATSLGCHTDLWQPRSGAFSPMAQREGWAALFAPLRPAADVLGPVRTDLAAECGLDAGCTVLCGIHDSNASYLRHRAARPGDAPFTVVSSGTWTILLAHGVDLGRLRQERDMLANVDAFGAAVATARFMGGREYAAVARHGGMPSVAGLDAVLRAGAMAFPSFAAGGPFQGHAGQLLRQTGLDVDAKASLASLYVALLTDHVLGLLGNGGEVVVDGPLAANPIFTGLLAAMRPDAAVLTSTDSAGSLGARALVAGLHDASPALVLVKPVAHPALADYCAAWRDAVGA